MAAAQRSSSGTDAEDQGAGRRICLFGTFDGHRHPRVEVLAEGLELRGYAIIRCNHPWSASTSERVAALRNPLIAARLITRLIRAWLGLRRSAGEVGDVDAVLVGYLGIFDVRLARRLWPDAYIVLDHLAPLGPTIEDRRGPRLAAALGRWLDRRAVRRADLTVVDTDEHRDGGAAQLTLPVGATTAWFETQPVEDVSGPLRVVFFGLFTPLQGAPLMAEGVRQALHQGANLRISFIGHGQDLQRCRRIIGDRSEVVWRTWVDPDNLPEVVASHHVCLGIFGQTSKALRVVPTKVFQGAAAGCAIVTSDTRPQRRLLREAAHYVPPGGSADLADALLRLAEDRTALADLRSRARGVAEERFHPMPLVEPFDRLLRSEA